MREYRSRSLVLAVSFLLAIAVPGSVSAQGAYPPNGPTIAAVPLTGSAPPPYPTPRSGSEQSEWHMELAGHSDLQGRSAYQPIISSQEARFIAYVGHHAIDYRPTNPLTGKAEASGMSIVDVTDPANTTYLAHVPGPGESGGAQMARVCSGNTKSTTHGLIYSADRAGTGLHIMRLTGAAAAAVARPGNN